jgi:monoamine oxidase
MSTEPSFRSLWARRLVREKLSAEINVHLNRSPRGPLHGLPAPLLGAAPATPKDLPPDPRFSRRNLALAATEAPIHAVPAGGATSLPDGSKVCIVGAGAAGLYIALTLDDLAIPGLSYDILEGSNRLGGRMFTHYFSDKKHDYYDIGAMRFPNIPVMQRVFKLFTKLKIPLTPYFLDFGSIKCPSRFNDRLVVDGDPAAFDPYHVSTSNGGSVPDPTIQKGADEILNEAFGPYKAALKENFDEGFVKLIGQDKFSTRQYLRDSPDMPIKYDFFSIQWMETQDTSTGNFDQAFSESVIDSFDFDFPVPKGDHVNWFCIDGGTSLLGEAMKSSVKGSVDQPKRVTSISIDRSIKSDANILVQCSDEKPRDPYVSVFNSTSLGCLQRIDLSNLELHPSQKDAIRCLHYDNSCKVGMKFSYPWWITVCGIKSGGTASTDLPLRTCVYPSYNINDPLNDTSVLLCCYAWSQDAQRISSLIHRNSPDATEQLLETLFHDLAKLHERDIGYDKIKSIIMSSYQSHHAFNWTHDPYTSGAFALFGPGQFEHYYPYLVRPAADGKFHMVGEASSGHHAWIVGALDSAYTAVTRFLYRYELWEALAKLKKNWGEPGEIETGEYGTAHLQVVLSQLEPKDHVRV